MRTVLLWIITQRVVVIPCRSFGTTYPSSCRGSRIRYFVLKPRQAITTTRCVITQNGAVLTHFPAGAWNTELFLPSWVQIFTFRSGLNWMKQNNWYTRHWDRQGVKCVTDTPVTRTVKGKSFPLQAWSGPERSRKLKFPDFMTMAQEGGKVVSLTHLPHLPPGNSPGTHFFYRLSRPQGHSAIGRIMSMKNSNDSIWDRTSDLLICSTAP